MSVRADDALLFCLVAAALVVAAHAVDALASRRDRGDGPGHSLALALCTLAVGMLVPAVVFSTSSTDLLITVSTFTAAVVSALPLLGVRGGDGTPERPANPWDRAYRVRPGRVAQLLSAPARTTTGTTTDAPTRRPRRPDPVTDPTPHQGVVVPSAPAPARTGAHRVDPAPADRTPGPPEVYEAEETLHDVTQALGDLGRLLGLDGRDRRRGA